MKTDKLTKDEIAEVEQYRKAAFSLLSPAQQYRVAFLIAENIGYELKNKDSLVAELRDTIESCAKIASSHNGISPKDSRDIATKIRLLPALLNNEI